jgi:LAO/AO transport system kinase
MNLAESLLQGDRRALARTLTHIENQTPDAEALLQALYAHGGKAWVIGVTGSPGTGKSSLVTTLAKVYRARGETVGILAVDPTSPFTGGAILGDRIRMTDLSGDKGVFIRSMASRGNLGGLSAATRDAIRVLDAAGFQRILVETVGAGQSEVDIVRAAHTTLVVEAPGLGDDVQAIKAGILEIADVLVVNKADRPGADNTLRSLRAMLELGHPTAHPHTLTHHGRKMQVEQFSSNADAPMWLPPVLPTVAVENKGIDEVIAVVDRHQVFLTETGQRKTSELAALEFELLERLQDQLLRDLLASLAESALADMVIQLQQRSLTPQAAVRTLLEKSPTF